MFVLFIFAYLARPINADIVHTVDASLSDLLISQTTLFFNFCNTLPYPHLFFIYSVQGAMMPSVFWEYVLSPTRSGVLTALDCVLRDSVNSGAKSNVFDALSAQQKDALRLYIATSEPVRQLTGTVLLFSLHRSLCKLCCVAVSLCAGNRQMTKK